MSHDAEDRTETSLQPQVNPAEVVAPQEEEERRKGKLSLRTKIIAGLAGASVVGASVAGLAISNNSKAEPSEQEQGNEQFDPNNGQNPYDPLQPTSEPTTPETEAPETEPSTPAEVIAAIDAENIPESILELGTFALLTPENQAKMREMYDLDINTFRAQPYEEQVAFGMQIHENMRPIIDHDLSSHGVNDLHYTDSPTTAQEIQDNFTYNDIMAARLITLNQDGSGFYDNGLALKMASIAQDVTVTSEDFWDSSYGQIDFYNNLWSIEGMIEQWKTTVTNESRAADGTLTYTSTNETGSATIKTRPVSYISLVDGSARQLEVTIDVIHG